MTDVSVYIGLGSSLGNRKFWIEWAIKKLALHPNIRFCATSRGYRTPPMAGGRAYGWFLNSVAKFNTTLTPNELLKVAKELEQKADRRREVHWGDRTLDVDVLLYGGTIIDQPNLKIPHPSFLKRPFVTTPLLEIDPGITDPRSGNPVIKGAHRHGPRAVPVLVVAAPRKLP